MGGYDECSQSVIDRLDDLFTLSGLHATIDRLREENGSNPHFDETAEKMLWLARFDGEHLYRPVAKVIRAIGGHFTPALRTRNSANL